MYLCCLCRNTLNSIIKKYLSDLSLCFDYTEIITPTYYVIYRLNFVSLFCKFNLGINTAQLTQKLSYLSDIDTVSTLQLMILADLL